MHWNYLVIIICLLLIVFAVIKEYRRVNKQRLSLRIIVSLLAIAALTAIALPIAYWTETTHPVNEAVLLTPGFSKDSLNQFKNDSLYTADAAINKQYPKTKLITLDQLKKTTPAIAKIELLGYGLTKDELLQLDSIRVVFHAAEAPVGIASVSWPQKIKQGQHIVVQGTFNNSNKGQVRLILKELNTSVDLATITEQGNTSFELSSLPKSSGRLVDRLLVLNGQDTLTNESLPFIIDPVIPVKVLVLASSPDFENKFLKNWLTEQEYSVAVRSTASKDKFSTQFVNMEQMALAHLSASILNKFDVVIADLSSLKSLSVAENALLKQQVNQNALGLIIRADTIFKTPLSLQNGLTVYKALTKDLKPVALQLQGEKGFSKIQNNGQLFISYKDGMQTLVSDAQNRIIAGIDLAGSGKIVCTTLDNTYSWMLAGNKNDYTAFWSLLIGKAAKATAQSENWTFATPLPSVNKPVTLQLETAGQPGQILMDNANASPKQNKNLPFQWQSTWWVKQSGWHMVQHTAGPPNWIYIYNTTDWASIKATNKILDTKKYASAQTLAAVTKQIHQKVKITVPKVYFYVLLLLCCTYLWVESKIAPKAIR